MCDISMTLYYTSQVPSKYRTILMGSTDKRWDM